MMMMMMMMMMRGKTPTQIRRKTRKAVTDSEPAMNPGLRSTPQNKKVIERSK